MSANMSKIEGEETLDSASSESDEVYPLSSIRIEKGRMSLFEIKRQCEERKQLILDFEFQRWNVWSQKQKSELIKSILCVFLCISFFKHECENLDC